MSLEWTLIVVLAEVAAVLATALGVVAFRALRRRRGELAAVEALVARVNGSREERRRRLAERLREAGLEEQAAADRAAELLRTQTAFCQRVIDLYFRRDHEALGRLDELVEGLLEPYRALVRPAPSPEPAAAEGGADPAPVGELEEQLAAARAENQELQRQIEALQRELGQMGDEYQRAFSRPVARAGPSGEGASGKGTPASGSSGREASGAGGCGPAPETPPGMSVVGEEAAEEEATPGDGEAGDPVTRQVEAAREAAQARMAGGGEGGSAPEGASPASSGGAGEGDAAAVGGDPGLLAELELELEEEPEPGAGAGAGEEPAAPAGGDGGQDGPKDVSDDAPGGAGADAARSDVAS